MNEQEGQGHCGGREIIFPLGYLLIWLNLDIKEGARQVKTANMVPFMRMSERPPQEEKVRGPASGQFLPDQAE